MMLHAVSGGVRPKPPVVSYDDVGTTAQEVTVDAKSLSHVHDDAVIDEIQARTPTDIKMVTGIDNAINLKLIETETTMNYVGLMKPRRSTLPEKSLLLFESTDSNPSGENL
ncbi:PREDICTED: uncharacterized protein LOC109592946 [Amphimedon queenslandica]|uniref:Uncharacterized protein n=1 Tax=Amphimedon queenslandica TaxID=400682 RepID=A0A1X7SIJ9_AMPQE|nr:PREDICTED: uncharacterized protein LOC109592946 [Amphimedon queenslandica]|eukprot:XP_019863804.1 PREDICTED: uncharacterized protein LOC109592946 [Amphimedon queenslandica]